MILYRPVSLEELALIYDSGMRAFPARLPKQPIFYPVLDLEYARKTASKWNVKNGQLAGYVTEFRVEDEYISKFEKHKVGKSEHQEFWVPAEEMEEFNKHIIGHIKTVEAYFGDDFQGFVPDQFGLQGKNAVEQLTILSNSYVYKRMEFYLEIKRNHKAVYLNYPFWQKYDSKNPSLQEKVLQGIKEAWFTSFPKIPLVSYVPPAKEAASPGTEFPVDENIEPMTKSDPSLPMQRVQQEAKTRKEPPASLAKPADNRVTSAKRIQPDSTAEPIDAEVIPEEQAPSASIEEEDDLISIKRRNSQFSLRPRSEESAPAKSAAEPLLLPPGDPRPSRPRPVNPHFLGSSVRKEIAPASSPVLPEERSRSDDPHFVRGIQLGLSGKYQQAIDELSRVIEEEPNHTIAHTSLGVALHRLGEDEGALNSYEAALTVDPTHAEAHYFRANIFYEHGDTREAIAGYTTAMGLVPDLIDAHQKNIPQDRLVEYTDRPAGMVWIAKPARRILDLNRSLETNPRQVNLLKERAAQYSRLGNFQQAIADYTAALKIEPDDANALHARGLTHELIGQQDQALEDFQRALAINPELSDVYINRGINFGKAGNFRQSINSLSEGIRLAPQNPVGYFNRGITYFYQGDFENAIDDFSNVIRLSPKDDSAYYWRGITNEEAGRPREAIADYKKFLSLSEDPRAKEEIEQRLSQWNEGTPNSGNTQNVVSENVQKTNQAAAKKRERQIDLQELITALGQRAVDSMWYGSGIESYGENAEELYASLENNRSISGRDLLRIASGIDQTTEGDFIAFDRDAKSGWLLIRAWQGTGFYVETNDPQSKQRLKTRFPSTEEMAGASPSYEGLFIPI